MHAEVGHNSAGPKHEGHLVDSNSSQTPFPQNESEETFTHLFPDISHLNSSVVGSQAPIEDDGISSNKEAQLLPQRAQPILRHVPFPIEAI